jgi:hypothetical protein
MPLADSRQATTPFLPSVQKSFRSSSMYSQLTFASASYIEADFAVCPSGLVNLTDIPQMTSNFVVMPHLAVGLAQDLDLSLLDDEDRVARITLAV